MHTILVSGNRPYFNDLLFLVLSLKDSQTSPVRLLVLTGDFTALDPRYQAIEETDRVKLESLLKKANKDSHVSLVDVKDLAIKEFPFLSQFNHRYTIYSLFRLLADLLPIEEEKILYLDLDTVVLKPLDELFQTDLTGYDAGMVLDAIGSKFLGRHYANSGLMLTNLPQIRKDGAFKRCREAINKSKKGMADQNAINRCCKKYYLSGDYNEQKKTLPSTFIRHYCRFYKFFPYPHDEVVRPTDPEAFKKKHPGELTELLAEYSREK
jgi:lipopolysaccharide biosynthesis glycosyltransferase